LTSSGCGAVESRSFNNNWLSREQSSLRLDFKNIKWTMERVLENSVGYAFLHSSVVWKIFNSIPFCFRIRTLCNYTFHGSFSHSYNSYICY
jgi:hypothetical protein